MKLKRLEAGRYQSEDGRVVIQREVSQQTRRADEVCWTVSIDGRTLPAAQDSKRDAVRVAEARLAQSVRQA